MRPRSLPFLYLCLVLLGLAAASFRLRPSPFPVGDEATHVLMARSLWTDRDLHFDPGDLREGYRIWNGGPAGVTLLTPDGGRSLRYAEPIAWALAAAPVQALLGPSGVPVLNMALFLAMLAAGAVLFREQAGAGLLLAGFFFASAAFGYVFRGSPEVFLMACVFFGLLLWKRTARTGDLGEFRALALAGALFAAASLHEPALALLGLAAVADLALDGRWKGAAVLVLSGVMVFGLLAAGQRKLTGVWNPVNPREGVQRRTFESEFPVESQADLWQAYGKSRPAADVAAGLRLLPRNLVYFAAGRDAGLLPYFPFGMFALALLARERSRGLLLAAIGAVVLLGLILEPHRWHGGPGALGNARFAVLYPALLFLPGRLAVRRSLVLPFAAAALWTLPALTPAVSAALSAGSADLPAFRALPLELTLLGDGVQLPGYRVRGWGEAVWVLPLATSWPDEGHPNGAWLKGASISEVVVVSPEPLERIRFNVHSLTADNELLAESGAGRVLVRFDSEGKRNGAPVDLPVKPVASGLGILPGAAQENVYRFTLTVSDGIIPARRLPGNPDPRYLGVFLDVTGKGL